MKNNETGELEQQIILCKWTLIPLAVLPPIVPSTDSDLQYFSKPSIIQVNDKMSAFSYQAQRNGSDGEYTQFVYLTDMSKDDLKVLSKYKTKPPK